MSTFGAEHGIKIEPDTHKMPADREEERRCQTCGARVTQTPTLGEVGHRRDCPEREKKYNGRGNARWKDDPEVGIDG